MTDSCETCRFAQVVPELDQNAKFCTAHPPMAHVEFTEWPEGRRATVRGYYPPIPKVPCGEWSSAAVHQRQQKVAAEIQALLEGGPEAVQRENKAKGRPGGRFGIFG